jgi:hypothetical protein
MKKFPCLVRDWSHVHALFGAIVGGVLALLANRPANAESFEGPSFQQGMWHFERKLERIGRPSKQRSVIMRQEMTRCVDPTNSMKATFASPDIGHCRSAKPDVHGHQYYFSMRCDYMGPVKTTITVESKAAYTEVNEMAVGPFPRVDTVIARRIGDCQ